MQLNVYRKITKILVWLGTVSGISLMFVTHGYAGDNEFHSHLLSSYQVAYAEKKNIQEWIKQAESLTKMELVKWIEQAEAELKSPADKEAAHDDKYIDFIISNLLLYLTTGEEQHLAYTTKYLPHLEKKLSDPMVSFYYYYAKATEALFKKDSTGFCQAMYHMYFDAIANIEATTPGDYSIHAQMSRDRIYLYVNVYDLIVKQAILRSDLPNLESISPIMWLLRFDLDPADKFFPFQSQEAKTVANSFTQSAADNFRLKFAVTMYEGDFVKATNTNNSNEGLLAARAWYIRSYEGRNPNSLKGKINSLSNLLRVSASLPDAPGKSGVALGYFNADADRPLKELTAAILEIKLGEIPTGYTNITDLGESLSFACNSLFGFLIAYQKEHASHDFNKPEVAAAAESSLQSVGYNTYKALHHALRLGQNVTLPEYTKYLAGFASNILANSYYAMAKYDKNNDLIRLAYRQYQETMSLFPFEPYTLAQLSAIETELGVEPYRKLSKAYHNKVVSYLQSNAACSDTFTKNYEKDYFKINTKYFQPPKYNGANLTDCIHKHNLEIQ